jgi:hypothetical protein
MKIVEIDQDEYIAVVEEHGIRFKVPYGHKKEETAQYILSVIQNYIATHEFIIANLKCWRVNDNGGNKFKMRYENLFGWVSKMTYRNQTLEDLNKKIQEEYDEWVKDGETPIEEDFRIHPFFFKGFARRNEIPEELHEAYAQKPWYTPALQKEMRDCSKRMSESPTYFLPGRYDTYRKD